MYIDKVHNVLDIFLHNFEIHMQNSFEFILIR